MDWVDLSAAGLMGSVIFGGILVFSEEFFSMDRPPGAVPSEPAPSA